MRPGMVFRLRAPGSYPLYYPDVTCCKCYTHDHEFVMIQGSISRWKPSSFRQVRVDSGARPPLTPPMLWVRLLNLVRRMRFRRDFLAFAKSVVRPRRLGKLSQILFLELRNRCEFSVRSVRQVDQSGTAR